MMNSSVRQPILVVDDEPQVLVALDDLLSERFIVRTAGSAKQALEIVDSDRDIAVVVTDQRMAGMTGDQLLAEVSTRTSAPGILVTGYADLTAVVRAVNDGQLFAYVTKPWDARELLEKVGKAAEQYRLMQELAAERKLLVDLINSSPDGICVKDLNLRFIRVNEVYADMLGREPAQLVGKRLTELLPVSTDALETESAEKALLVQGTAVHDQVRPAHSPTGSRWYSAAKAPLRAVDGTVSGLVEIKRDVTDRVAISEALLESEEKSREKSRLLHSILDSMNDGVVVSGSGGEFLLVNPNAKSLLGVDAWDVNLATWTTRCGVLASEGGAPLLASEDPLYLATQGLEPREIEVIVSNSVRRDTRVALKATPLRDGRRVVGGIAVLRDVTEQRNLERQLLQSQKMDAVGQLAGGVAHDFNNALAVMSIYAGLVTRGLPADDPKQQDMGELMRAIDRASALTRQLLAFGRVQSMQITSVDLNEVISGLEKMLRRLIGEGIELSTVQHPNLPTIRADVSQIEQVIMNLVINARDAMPHGGKLRIETSVASAFPSRDPTRGNMVVLTVADTGTGMSDDVRSHIFEPFFTTKAVGKGTGLGLSTVHGIVKQNGGHIDVESELGKGTRFNVHFHRGVGNAVVAPTLSLPPVSESGGQTILLVESDDAVRRAAGRILAEHGYIVIETSSADEARAAFLAPGTTIDLLLTDMVLGATSGADIAAELQQHAPGARHLFMSGYMDADMSAKPTFQQGHQLPKPFTPSDLTSAVRKALLA
jgi:two-component system cell cycle sensor histidine kinase/response regulator CckA